MRSSVSTTFKSIFVKDKEFFKIIADITGVFPSKPEIYKVACTHKSVGEPALYDFDLNNERLEFLGDAVLDAIIAHYLFEHYPGKDEGFLTKMKSKIVNTEHLNLLAQKIGLDDLVLTLSGKVQKKFLFGDALEAFIGAIYIDKGFSCTKKFVLQKLIKGHIDLRTLEKQENNFKSMMIEWAQHYKRELKFETIETTGKLTAFCSEILIDNKVEGTGTGNSKKEAEQNAAKNAVKTLNIDLLNDI